MHNVGMVKGIEDYAVIGDGRTCALISRTGDLDWLCLPGLDSPASFAGLLGGDEFGHWSLTISGAEVVSRRYEPGTFILLTEYATPQGRAMVTEWMPVDGQRNDIVRRVECTEGTVRVEQRLRVRFGYGRIVPWAAKSIDANGEPVLRFVAGPDSLTLHSPGLPQGRGHQHSNEVDLDAGQRFDQTLTWTQSWDPTPARIDVDASHDHTRTDWQNWCADADLDGADGTHVRRSLLSLRLLSNNESGGIAAAATTSLPEECGGVRN